MMIPEATYCSDVEVGSPIQSSTSTVASAGTSSGGWSRLKTATGAALHRLVAIGTSKMPEQVGAQNHVSGSALPPPELASTKGAADARAEPAGPVHRHSLDHRALLFGSRFGRSMAVNAKGRAAAENYAAQERATLEEKNDMLIAELQSKVTELKECTLDIKSEVTASNGLLDSLDAGFTQAQGLVLASTARLQKALGKSGGHHMLIMVLFVLVLLISLYLFVVFHHRRGSHA